MGLLTIADDLSRELDRLEFSAPVVYVYNPLRYAREPHAEYLRRYGEGGKKAVFLGMNPGPWGMAQTGVPFGEIEAVRHWLEIDGQVGRPEREHPKKRVEGFGCHRREVSGKRLWGLFRERFETPGRFFARFFVLNYCPLLFLDRDGGNLTPDRLKAAEREELQAACDRALRRSIEELRPQHVVGVGNFAAARADAALAGLEVVVGRILHPSPANPLANRDWAQTALAQLREQGIEL